MNEVKFGCGPHDSGRQREIFQIFADGAPRLVEDGLAQAAAQAAEARGGKVRGFLSWCRGGVPWPPSAPLCSAAASADATATPTARGQLGAALRKDWGEVGRADVFSRNAGGRSVLGSSLLVGSLAFSAWATQAAETEAEEGESAPTLGELPSEPVVLYQYEVCPFCNKLRAFLDYNDIPYKVVEVNPMTKAEIKGMKKNKNGKLKVPIVGLPGTADQLVESDEIIDEFQRLLDDKSGASRKSKPWLFGGSRVRAEEEAQELGRWRKWVNDKFVHILTVNIYRSVEESFETFNYISDQGNFGFFAREAARYGGAGIMYFVSKNIKKKKDLPGDERDHLYEAARLWLGSVGGKDFHGGSKPDLADLSVYGVMRAIEGFQSFKDMLANTDVGPWYFRVKEAVGASARVNPA